MLEKKACRQKTINISKVKSKNKDFKCDLYIHDNIKKVLRKQKREAQRRGAFFQCATGGNVSSLRNVVSLFLGKCHETPCSQGLS